MRRCPVARLPFARWQGESLAGKRFLLWFEQGFGDQIQFCRYASRLREAGASSIEFVCAPPLCRLMESLAGVDRVIPFGTDTTFSRPDFWALPLDLPGLFATDIASIPARLPYLAAQGDEISRWAARLPTAGLRVGLVEGPECPCQRFAPLAALARHARATVGGGGCAS